MMTAIWRGTGRSAGTGALFLFRVNRPNLYFPHAKGRRSRRPHVIFSLPGHGRSSFDDRSHLRQLLGLLRDHTVDLLDVLIGQLLHLLFAASCSSSSVISLFFCAGLELFHGIPPDVAERHLAVLAVSWTLPLVSSLRRSSVSGGKARRITLPSFWGLMPRSEVWMAFSIALSSGAVPGLDHQACAGRARRWPPPG